LTELQRKGWEALAPKVLPWNKESEHRTLTGFEAFRVLNTRRLYNSSSFILNPPPATPPPSMPGIISQADASSETFTVALKSMVPGQHMFITEATPPLSKGVTQPGNRFKVVRRFSQTNAISWTISAQYEALFGPLQRDQKIFVRVFIESSVNAFRSRPDVVPVIVTF
jgi:hypothetical protein